VPLYEYQCPVCDHRIEMLQRLGSDAPECSRCDHAGNGMGPEGVLIPVMKKQISRTTFALKGDGWFKDHYGLKPVPPVTQE
jgi:predicted nucleic acid-binding Zn ribbon protein